MNDDDNDNRVNNFNNDHGDNKNTEKKNLIALKSFQDPLEGGSNLTTG